jgi:hypothetical protein
LYKACHVLYLAFILGFTTNFEQQMGYTEKHNTAQESNSASIMQLSCPSLFKAVTNGSKVEYKGYTATVCYDE